jgi:hypothetical protein
LKDCELWSNARVVHRNNCDFMDWRAKFRLPGHWCHS